MKIMNSKDYYEFNELVINNSSKILVKIMNKVGLNFYYIKENAYIKILLGGKKL